MNRNSAFDAVTLEILWGRLIAAVDEAAAALVRTSFSTGVRESNDFACVLMDSHGNSLAENRGGIPSFCGCIGRTTRELLARFPRESWKPDDVVLTNDPWLGTGHLPDITVVSPIFYQGRLVAFAGSVAHNPDIGGAGFSADCTEVFEEGLRVPPLKIVKNGEVNEDLIEVFRANSRIPDECVGDIMAQVASGKVMAAGVVELLEDQKLDGVDELSALLQQRAERVMRDAIARIPDGVYRSTMMLDGFEEPLKLVCAITVKGEEMVVDYAGTSPAVRRGINCVEHYTWAYTTYPLKCILDPNGPRNEGCFRPIRVVSPPGSILNATFPAPCSGRHLVGHVLSANIFAALGQAIPELVIADSGSAPGFRTIYSGHDVGGERFHFILFANGGMGARPNSDGLACTQYPSNTAAASIEVMETLTPMIVWRKQLYANSGGAGEWRGGDGQEIVIEMGETPVRISVMAERMLHPAQGMFGGQAGTPVALNLTNRDVDLPRKGRTILEPGDVLRLRYAGGGGYGDPKRRSRDLVRADLRDGLITEEAARETYGLRD
jgi:N-methylhydantoinase B